MLLMKREENEKGLQDFKAVENETKGIFVATLLHLLVDFIW